MGDIFFGKIGGPISKVTPGIENLEEDFSVERQHYTDEEVHKAFFTFSKGEGEEGATTLSVHDLREGSEGKASIGERLLFGSLFRKRS